MVIHKTYLPTILLFLVSGLMAQQPGALLLSKIEQAQIENKKFVPADVLGSPQTAIQRGQHTINGFSTDALFYEADLQALKSLSNSQPEALLWAVPLENEVIYLELVLHNLFAENARVVSTDHPEGIQYQRGIHYNGVVQGKENSLAALSIFEDGFMCVFSSNETGNVNLGRYQGTDAGEATYILFRDNDLLVSQEGSCATPQDDRNSNWSPGNHSGDGTRTTRVPKVYLEADFQLYQNKGSVSATADYLTGIFNVSSTIYENDGINMEISEIYVWTVNDGYASGSSFSALSDFMDFRTTFNGDVAHLCALDPGGLGGVAATINGLCNPNKYCYSDIDASYSAFPTYSWTVMVFTHELGHLFGSYHTQWCGWPGGAIDNCYETEGPCSPGPAPSGGGTIMSYCHLTGYGINFNNGFGPYPSEAIIDAIEAADCLEGGGGAGTYCESAGSNSSEEWIDRVRLGSINRVSGSDGGYFDGTSLSTNMKQGMTKTMRISAGMSGGSYTEYWSVWIDFNQDLDFEDAGELIFSTSSSSTGNILVNVSIPFDATTGSTRMRVSMKYGSAPGSCELFTYGEVEDYTIQITPLLPDAELVLNEVEISPNPATDIVQVKWPFEGDEEVHSYITDLQGRIIWQQQSMVVQNQLLLDIQSLPPGMYLLHLSGRDFIKKTHYMIKQ